MSQFFFFSFLFLIHSAKTTEPDERCEVECDSEIYCRGELLKTVQTANIYSSRYFVDMRLKDSPQNILNKFQREKESFRADHTKNRLKNFIDENFEPDTLPVYPLNDFKDIPYDENEIPDVEYRKFATAITQKWKELAVKIPDDVRDRRDYHSMIYLQHPYIKSDELTTTPDYLQNYWIFRGLLANDMFETAAGIIQNYADLINEYGFVLQTNRVYASKRSQIPVLATMMEDYTGYTKISKNFLERILKSMETEFLWWFNNRRIMVKLPNDDEEFGLFVYEHDACEPRPEEYYDDYIIGKKLKTKGEKTFFFSAAFSLSETGFGYSSRFVRNNLRTPVAGSRLNLDVENIIPVDLNSMLERYAYLLSTWFSELGDSKKSSEYSDISADIEYAIQNVLWNEQEQMWFDWDLEEDDHRKTFSITNMMPMFTSSFDSTFMKDYTQHVLNYLVTEKILQPETYEPRLYIIPTTKENTGEYWDYPFGSPSLNLFLIEGFWESKLKNCEEVAKKLAKMLFKTCYEGFAATKVTYGQYSAEHLANDGKRGSEFPREAYASTNGALLVLMKWYGRELRHTDYDGFDPLNTESDTGEYHLKKKRRLNVENEAGETSMGQDITQH